VPNAYAFSSIARSESPTNIVCRRSAAAFTAAGSALGFFVNAVWSAAAGHNPITHCRAQPDYRYAG
jgi:hypothetical protein